MTTYIMRRAVSSAVTLLVVAVVVFALSRMIGNPVSMYLDPSATADDRERLTRALGLDQPYVVQFAVFAFRAIFFGDLGRSFHFSRPVTEIFFDRFWDTVQLGAVSFVFSMALAVPIGILSAARRNSWWDYFGRVFVFFGQALPSFWLGIMMILIFAVKFNLVPPAGKEGPESFILPAITLGWAAAAGVARMVRSSMLDVLASNYIRTARSKGLGERMVLTRHALKNAMIPAVAYSSVVLVRTFVIGSIVVETVFGWPGIGRLAYESTFARDYPLIQGIVVMIAIIVIGVNLLSDILYGWLDPRIRYA